MRLLDRGLGMWFAAALLLGWSALAATGPMPEGLVAPAASLAPSPGSLPADGPVGADAGEVWIDGVFTSQWGLNCIIIDDNYEEIMVQAFTGYWGRTDATSPRVGEVYYGRIFLSIPGNACSDGITEVFTNLVLPQDTFLAQSLSDPVRCYYASASTGGSFVDVTNDPTANCPHNPGSLGGGWYNMGWRPLAQGAQFQIIFPIYSTKQKNGIADGTSQMTAEISSPDTPNTVTRPNNAYQYPYQWVFVAPNPPTIEYPNPSTVDLTTNFGRSLATLRNHHTAGTIYFDLGTSTSYGTSAPGFAVTSAYDWISIYQDWHSLTPGTTYHWRMRFVHTGGTTFGTNQSFTTSGTAPVAGESDDFSGDGKSDLFWRQPSTGKNIWWSMNGASRTSYGSLLNVPGLAWSIAGTGDFTGDGKPDILWRNSSTGQNVVWTMNGTSRTAFSSILSVPAGWDVGGIADFDGDGDADIVWRNGSSGQNVLWWMNGMARQSFVSLLSVQGPEWKLAGAGDLDGDGDPDLMWRNYTSGQNVIWFMNGASRSSYASTLAVSGSAWRLMAIGEYDGNGKADLVWRNVTNGQNVLWSMDGANRLSFATIMSVPDLSWEVQSPR